MKPNGMRAWRRLAKRWRRKQNRHNRETGAPWIADGTGRWYRRQQAFFKQRPTVHAPAFRTWSLVGMTMGARKRAARVACVGQRFRRRVKLVWFKSWAREAHQRPLTDADQRSCAQYAAERAKYQIGERLRPCPGCLGCCAPISLHPQLLADARKVGIEACDGAGVLPARGR